MRGHSFKPELCAVQVAILIHAYSRSSHADGDTNKCFDKDITEYQHKSRYQNKQINQYKLEDKLISKHETQRITVIKYTNQVHQEVQSSTVTCRPRAIPTPSSHCPHTASPLPHRPHSAARRFYAALTPLPRCPTPPAVRALL